MDVMFVKDFQPADIPHTAVVAVGAETRRAGSETQSKDNPGVLYINIEVGCNGSRTSFEQFTDTGLSASYVVLTGDCGSRVARAVAWHTLQHAHARLCITLQTTRGRAGRALSPDDLTL